MLRFLTLAIVRSISLLGLRPCFMPSIACGWLFGILDELGDACSVNVGKIGCVREFSRYLSIYLSSWPLTIIVSITGCWREASYLRCFLLGASLHSPLASNQSGVVDHPLQHLRCHIPLMLFKNLSPPTAYVIHSLPLRCLSVIKYLYLHLASLSVPSIRLISLSSSLLLHPVPLLSLSFSPSFFRLSFPSIFLSIHRPSALAPSLASPKSQSQSLISSHLI